MDSLGIAIPGVNVVVTGPYVQGSRGGLSDASGHVSILAIQPGKAFVRLSHSAYQPVVFENVLIQLGRTTTLGNVKLRARVHEMPELIISSVRSPLLDPVTTHSGGNIRMAEVEGIPVQPDFKSFLSLLPQANTSYFADEVNVAGASGMDNRYFVDGVDVTETFYGWSGTTLPYNFVNEVDLKEGGYEAEYSGALGGVINVITPSGGNEFHGSLTGFLTSNRFAPNKRMGLYDPTQGGFSNYDVGVGLGGPLIPDQLWFYAAYNPKAEERDVPVPGFGTAIDRYLTHSFAGKLTWRASPNLQVVLITMGDPTTRLSVGEGMVIGGLANPDPFLIDRKYGGIDLSLRTSYASEGGFLLDASVSRSTRRNDWVGSTERGRNEIRFTDWTTGKNILSGGIGYHSLRFISHNTFGIDVTLPLGAHTLKGGARYKVAGVNDDEAGKYISWFGLTYYDVSGNGVRASVGYRIPSLYAQDTWRVTEGLRIHFGLRWDNQYMMASDGTVAQKFTNEFQPRAGITFMPDESQKISASFGRFYQELCTVNSIINYAPEQYNFYINYFDHDPRVDPSGGDTVVNMRTLEGTGLKGQYFDEFTLGYERLIGENLKVGVQGIYRTLREAVGSVVLVPGTLAAFGNPGSGLLSQAPEAKHDYTALVVSLQGALGSDFNILASYVLSRNYGNYSGIYEAINHSIGGNGAFLFNLADDPAVYTGLLPNDRTHVLKCAMAYRFGFGLVAGTSFSWQTGTPLSETGWNYRFITQRGTGGRTPSIWDLNARLAYDLPPFTGWQPRLLLDLLHIASRQEVVDVVQQHYLDPTEQMVIPYYGLAIRYQPAMAARLGMELRF